MGQESLDTEGLRQRARKLAVKRGMSLGTLDPVELALLLVALTQTLAPDEPFDEKRFNQRMDHWLGHEGRIVRSDFAELRRTLVDRQFVRRDAFGKVYRRAPAWPAHFAAICSAVGTLDLRAEMADAQAEEDRRRDERKRRALAPPPPRP
jgi:hypothetical protein